MVGEEWEGTSVGIANNRHLTIGRYRVLTRSMVKTSNTNNYRLTFCTLWLFQQTCAPRYKIARPTDDESVKNNRYLGLNGRCFQLRQDLKGIQGPEVTPCGGKHFFVIMKKLRIINAFMHEHQPIICQREDGFLPSLRVNALLRSIRLSETECTG